MARGISALTKCLSLMQHKVIDGIEQLDKASPVSTVIPKFHELA